MTRDEMVTKQLKQINETAKKQREMVRKLSNAFEYSEYGCLGSSFRVEPFCNTFEDYLAESAKLPENELHSYDLYWHKDENDSLVITHSVKNGKHTLYYRFLVGEPERTLELLTEGKCKMIKKITEPSKPTTYTALSCEA